MGVGSAGESGRRPGGAWGPWIAIATASALIVLGATLAAGRELRNLQTDTIAQLAAAAEAKAAHVASWRAERLSDGRSIAAHPLVARAALRASATDRADLVAWALSRMERPEYVGVSVISPAGELIARVGPDVDASHAVAKLRSGGDQALLLDLHENPTGGALHADVVAALRLEGRASRDRFAAVVLRIDPSILLLPIVHSWREKSPMSRTFLVNRGTGTVLCPCDRQGETLGRVLDAAATAPPWLDPSARLAAVRPVPGSAWSVATIADPREIHARFGATLRWIAALAAALMALTAAVALGWRGHQEAAHERRRREAEQERDALARIEAALRESEDKFRAAFFGARVGTALVDAQGRFLEVNEALARMLKYDAAELRARTFRELLHADDLAGSSEAFAKLVSGERAHNDMERRYVRKDGRIIHARYSVSAIRDPRGAFVAAVGIIEDVTESVRAVEELRRSEERLQLALEATNDGVWDWDAARDEVYLSPRFRMLLGTELPRPARRGDVTALLHPAERPALEKVLDDVAAGRRPGFEVEHRFRSGSGWIWVLERAKAVAFDANGVALRVVGACTDVTERRGLQAQLFIADRMASIGTLAAGVAHEINNPLAYVVANLGFAREALSRLASSSEMASVIARAPAGDGDVTGVFASFREALDEASDGAERVRRIVLDLKALSRTDEATLPVDVRGVLESSLAVARHDIVCRATLVKRLAPVPRVAADEGRLGQVFLNLLVNAAQAIPEGEPSRNEIRVTTAAADSGGHVVVEISDTGCGIPPEDVERIFDPFFTTKPAGVGTGLGLAISRRIVASLGGDIQVRTEVGKGSTFRVFLPSIAKTAAESAR